MPTEGFYLFPYSYLKCGRSILPYVTEEPPTVDATRPQVMLKAECPGCHAIGLYPMGVYEAYRDRGDLPSEAFEAELSPVSHRRRP